MMPARFHSKVATVCAASATQHGSRLMVHEAMDGLLEGSVFAYVSMYALIKDRWAE